MKRSIFAVLSYAYLLLQPAPASLIRESSEREPLDESIKRSSNFEPEVPPVHHEGRLQRRFESAEHKLIGDNLRLFYDDEKEVPGIDFQYVAGSHTLSLGDVVALAGDFYGNWKTLSTGCVEQISDSWTVDPERSISLFLTVAEWLSSDNGGYLKCILENMAKQEKNVTDSVEQGKDPAQAYKMIAEEYDTIYTKCTWGGYGWIALCNFDHFGIDAVHAYSAGHIAALRQAKKAKETGSSSDLKQAYFLEGFALHYLTDLFSTGHLREPRRILHKTITDEPALPEFWPADRCAQRQHDEDCANGLWLRNRRGEAWPAYGDKQLFNKKSDRNRDQAIDASQSGVSEIWLTYKDGQIPPVEHFEALKRIPILDDLNQPPNFVPLFEYNADDPASLYFRKELSERNDSAVTKLSSSMTRDEWFAILAQIDAAPANINMYPFSESFTSTAETVHFRQISPSKMAINFYGPLEPGPVWNMRGQTVSSTQDFGETNWVSMNDLGNDAFGDPVFSLVGSTSNGAPGTSNATHMGVGISKPNYETSLKWDDNFNDGNVDWTLIDAIHGTYSRDSQDIAMVKYWRNGPEKANKLELYTIPANFRSSPARVDLDWPIGPINHMFTYRISADQSSNLLVTLAYELASGETTWSFTTWSNGYKEISTDSFLIKPSFSVQAILTGTLPSGAPNNSIVLLSYGDKFPWPKSVGIEVIQPSVDPSGKVSALDSCFKIRIRVTALTQKSSDFLLWFLSDVDGDGNVDIVGYASSKSDTTLTVFVFPGNGGCTFLDPILSDITIPAEKGTLFTADFMHPLYARQAPYSYSEDLKTGAGILSFFDNYGILGARMIAPVSDTGSFQYEFKGQIPAVAGQLSQGLGWRAQNLMDRGESGEAIGFADFP